MSKSNESKNSYIPWDSADLYRLWITPGPWSDITQLPNSAETEAHFIWVLLGTLGAVARSGWRVFQTEPLSASPPAEQTGPQPLLWLWRCVVATLALVWGNPLPTPVPSVAFPGPQPGSVWDINGCVQAKTVSGSTMVIKRMHNNCKALAPYYLLL